MSEEDINYKKAVEYTIKFHQEVVGYSNHVPFSLTDKIILKQNNTIIALLIELNIKVDKILKEKQPELIHKNTDIDELISQLKKVEITPKPEK